MGNYSAFVSLKRLVESQENLLLNVGVATLRLSHLAALKQPNLIPLLDFKCASLSTTRTPPFAITGVIYRAAI